MKKHLNKVGKTYLQHLTGAYKYAFKLQMAVFAALIHGLLPNLFETTASYMVKRLSVRVNLQLDKNR